MSNRYQNAGEAYFAGWSNLLLCKMGQFEFSRFKKNKNKYYRILAGSRDIVNFLGRQFKKVRWGKMGAITCFYILETTE